MLKLAGEKLEGQLAEHIASLDAHTFNPLEIVTTGRYYSSFLRAYSSSVGRSIIQNRLYAMPFPVLRPITVDRIAIEVSTAGAGGAAIRLGIYNNGTNLTPGTLLLDAGTVDATSTGLKAITISQALTKGIYWLVLLTNDGTIDVWANITAMPLLGRANSLKWGGMTYYKGFTYGTLPDPFGNTLTDEIYHFQVGLRIASLD